MKTYYVLNSTAFATVKLDRVIDIIETTMH